MKSDSHQKRRQQIESAAYELLTQKGYNATSMLAIAKRASASNETLYKWYGNKQQLFANLVHENARAVKERLIANINADPIEAMQQVGPKLLRLVTSEKAVTLNRAAAGDYYETGELGKTISTGGRESVLPLISNLFDRAREKGLMQFDDATEVASVYVNLLVGDLQIQRVIGARGELKAQEIRKRAKRAEQLMIKLYGTKVLIDQLEQV